MNMEKQNWFDTKVWLTAFIMILVLAVIYVFANLNNLTGIQLPVVVTAGISIFLLVLSGYGLGRIWNEKSYYGILLVRSQKLIREIDMLSKKFRSQLTFLADVALVWGTGLFGVYVLYKNCSPRRVVAASVFGFVMLAITILFILPLVNQLIPYTIKGINYTKAYSQTEREMSGVVVLVSHVLFVIGGFMFSFAFSLLYNAGITILNTIMVVFSGASPIEPTATAIIPGVSIPLVEGIIALVCLLVVHEVSHGLLARAADVKLTSVGIALLGVLPMGAFVEPDDEELEKRSMIEKVRVFVAGSGANFALMFLAFVIFILFQPVVAQYAQYYVVYVGNNTEYSGATVLAIKGIPVDKLDYENLPYKAGDNVTVETDKGTFTAIVNDNGKVGVVEKMMITNPFVSFAFNVIVLLIVLNFYIAAFNLIPVSILDGYHILRTVVGEKNVKYLSYALLASLASMFLPWLWK